MLTKCRLAVEIGRVLSGILKPDRSESRGDINIATLCLALLVAMYSLATAGNEPPPFAILMSGGPSVALGEYAEDYHLGAHGGGGIQFRLSLKDSYALSLILRLDYYRYTYTYRYRPHYWSSEIVETEDEDNHATVEADLMMTFFGGRTLHLYGLVGIGTLEFASSLTTAGIGADLAFISSEGLIPFVEFRAGKAALSSLKFDVGFRLGS